MTARFNYVAGRMEPKRIAVSVFETDGGAGASVVTLACGHEVRIVSHFHVAVGYELSCNACGKLAAAKLPEFMEVK